MTTTKKALVILALAVSIFHAGRPIVTAVFRPTQTQTQTTSN